MTPQELKDFLAQQEQAPHENALDRWRREVREREAEHVRERAQSRNFTDAEMARWINYVHELIAETIAAERERTTALLAELLAYIQCETAGKVRKLRQERNDAKADLVEETRRLRIELAQLQVVVGELRQALAQERGRPLDLPALPRARDLN